MKPDIIVSWPLDCDYPLWRLNIREIRNKLGKVIVVFTGIVEKNKIDYRNFLYKELGKDHITCVNSPRVPDGADWRNIAVNYGLRLTSSDWIWFTEQDFYPQPGFLDFALRDAGPYVRAVFEGDRMHPACIVMNRKVLNGIRKDFSIDPGHGDHFCKIARQLNRQGINIEKIPAKYYFHYNGLSQNWKLSTTGQMPNYHPDEFLGYLENCMTAPITLHRDFVSTAKKTIQLIKQQHLSPTG